MTNSASPGLILVVVALVSGCAQYRSVNVEANLEHAELPEDTNLCVETKNGSLFDVSAAHWDGDRLEGMSKRQGEVDRGFGICGKHGRIDWSFSASDSLRVVSIRAEDIESITYDGPHANSAAVGLFLAAGIGTVLFIIAQNEPQICLFCESSGR